MKNAACTQILLIEDNLDDAFLFSEILGQRFPGEFDITHTVSLEKATETCAGNPYDIALLDMNLPGISGIAAIERFQKDRPNIPLIVLTGLDDEEAAFHAVQNGCQDYLVKGKNEPEVIRRSIRYAIQRKFFEEKLLQLAHYDQLTGLANRELFQNRLEYALSEAKNKNVPLAVFFIELNGFKDVNDSLGHSLGDTLLREVAERLRDHLSDCDTVARFGSDEFIVMTIGKMAEKERCQKIAKRIIASIDQPYSVGQKLIHVSCSVGIATFPLCGNTMDELLKNADIAVHHAKQKGRNLHRFYTSSLNEEISERIVLERALGNAIDKNQLEIHYQPLVDIVSKRIEGVEALLRWHHPDVGSISPERFIPIAEQTGLIVPIGAWVMEKVCEEYKYLSALVKQPFHVSVNVSGAQIQDKNMFKQFLNILRATNVSPRHIALELTESVIMDNPQHAIDLLSEFKNLGMQIFVDDFGTGYSSLSYLSKLPIDVLKVDRSFVKDIVANDNDKILAKAIINLAHNLDLSVIAEGVETEEQLSCLSHYGTDKAQGYLFARPMALQGFSDWIKKK